ncbi:hypothetical protein EK904_008944 [Melospiza melodia maxima]|nr:hypothetical protein EK904_008944 [Melospiza melodia maxima]
METYKQSQPGLEPAQKQDSPVGIPQKFPVAPVPVPSPGPRRCPQRLPSSGGHCTSSPHRQGSPARFLNKEHGDIMIRNFSYSNMTQATAELLNLRDSKAKLQKHRAGTSCLGLWRGRSLPRQGHRPQQPRCDHRSSLPLSCTEGERTAPRFLLGSQQECFAIRIGRICIYTYMRL